MSPRIESIPKNWETRSQNAGLASSRPPPRRTAATRAARPVASSVSTAMAHKAAGRTAASNLPQASRRWKRPSGSSLTMPITELQSPVMPTSEMTPAGLPRAVLSASGMRRSTLLELGGMELHEVAHVRRCFAGELAQGDRHAVVTPLPRQLGHGREMTDHMLRKPRLPKAFAPRWGRDVAISDGPAERL